jgi:hypothetical protein
MDSLPNVLIFDIKDMINSKPFMFDVFADNENKQMTISFLTCLSLEYILRKINRKKDFLQNVRRNMPRSHLVFINKNKSAKETFKTYFDHIFGGYVVPNYDYVMVPYNVFNNWCIGVALMYVHYHPNKEILKTEGLSELVMAFRELCTKK